MHIFWSILQDLYGSVYMELILVVFVLWVIEHFYKKYHDRKLCFYEEIYNIVKITYFVFFTFIVLNMNEASSGINLVPFKEITRYPLFSYPFYSNVIGNILLFLPLSFFLNDYFKHFRFLKTIVLTASLSFLIEFVQLKIGRAFDVDDIILNVSGAFIGFLCYIMFSYLKEHLPHFLRKTIFYNFVTFILLVFVIIIICYMIGWLN